ncbi:actin-binding protein IPP-like [Saccostrea echinata]|uniref:actin-binding protein IPP-like n=1 Tax=Saccostrea echinata TaxID=191078 RepID=UPI002A822E40|nr:actin-binding protein IPP-like [Saccostrea echinata]
MPTEQYSIEASILRDFRTGLKEFLDSEQFTDVTIKVENESFKCHRVILSSMSPYFSRMFSAGMRESTEETITINGFSPSIMKDCLLFIYTLGEGNSRFVNTWEDLLHASTYFQIESLQMICETEISTTQLAVNSVCNYYEISQQDPSYVMLKGSCEKFIMTNFVDLASSEEFSAFSVETFLSILENKDLQVEEYWVGVAVLNYLTARVGNLEEDEVKEILSVIHFPMINKEHVVHLQDQFLDLIKHKYKEMKNVQKSLEEIFQLTENYHNDPSLQIELISDFRSPNKELNFITIGATRSFLSDSEKLQIFDAYGFPLSELPFCKIFCNYGESSIVMADYFGNLFVFDFLELNLQKIVDCELLPRKHMGMIAVKDSVYVFGGIDNITCKASNRIDQYCFADKSWRNCGKLLEGVQDATAINSNDKLYIFGGFNDSMDILCQKFQCFDPSTGETTLISYKCNDLFTREHVRVVGQGEDIYVTSLVDGSIHHFNPQTLELEEFYESNYAKECKDVVKFKSSLLFVGSPLEPDGVPALDLTNKEESVSSRQIFVPSELYRCMKIVQWKPIRFTNDNGEESLASGSYCEPYDSIDSLSS